MKPKFITFTGVDSTADYDEMVRLALQYPVEWGILFSPSRQGIDPRYPTLKAIHTMVNRLRDGLAGHQLSAHLCGAAALDVIEDHRSEYWELLEEHFTRVQLNTRRSNLDLVSINKYFAGLGVTGIIQCRDQFPDWDHNKLDMLFDASGGRGLYPSDWPYEPTSSRLKPHPVGYAGGLAPHNVAAAVEIIQRRAGVYWIDMESGVRDENNHFDLGKCRAVCEAVYGADYSK